MELISSAQRDELFSTLRRDEFHTEKVIRRLRVVTEPLTEYVRFEWEITPDSLAAGEDIRWLPRHLLPPGIVFPRAGLDWWLFDDRLAAAVTTPPSTPSGARG